MEQNPQEIIFLQVPTTTLLDLAFRALCDFEDLVPIYMSEEEIRSKYETTVPRTTTFVLSDFTIPIFHQLRKLTNAIYGPQVILHYLREGKPVPEWKTPLYSTALFNSTITFTSFPLEERKLLSDKAHMMHGVVFSDLTEDVNVIIASKVGSKKYIVGGSRKVNILLPSWIEEAWQLSSIQDPINLMADLYLEKFKIPIFHKLVICVSGLSVTERKEVSELVTSNGGSYSGQLQVGSTTHLIVHKPGGPKYDNAKKWKIQIIKLNWLTDSVSNGYAMDEDNYRISESEQPNFSTPSKNVPDKFPGADYSVINNPNSSCSRINETSFHNTTFKRPSNHFLAGVVVNILNCSTSQKSELTRLAKSCGAHICVDLQDQVSDRVTHTVIGELNPKFKIKLFENDMLYVCPEWLITCAEKKTKLLEAPYLYQPPVEFSHKPGFLNSATVFLVETVKTAQLIALVEDNGGVVLTVCGDDCDYHVNEMFPAELSQCLTSRAVSVPWLEQSVRNKHLLLTELEGDMYFTPIALKAGKKPLEGCVVSMTGFVEFERGHVKRLATDLGALVQDVFVKTDMPNLSHKACTHLLALKPEGKKYEAALQWKIPVVRVSWLKQSATLGCMADVTQHIVGASAAAPVPRRLNELLKENKVPKKDDLDSTMANATDTPPSKFLTKGVAYKPKLVLKGFGVNSMPTPEWVNKTADPPKDIQKPAFLVTPDSEKRDRRMAQILAQTEQLPKRVNARTGQTNIATHE
ncbi:DNA topoisomerase 2-binding protein 1 [Cichlidogyrus casuarinus]|uniref:DNA topoisomerase 2-binding protein 1 n=1 Tax=Cichlidogyrus casuarinus TaxID=1844966 RepID=A0ABD2PNZ8_9PLAT